MLSNSPESPNTAGRKTKFLENFSLDSEPKIAGVLKSYNLLNSLNVLIVGDPKLKMARHFTDCHLTVVETDKAKYQGIENKATSRGIKLINGTYPLNDHADQYDLCVFKNIFHFNDGPSFLASCFTKFSRW